MTKKKKVRVKTYKRRSPGGRRRTVTVSGYTRRRGTKKYRPRGTKKYRPRSKKHKKRR